MIRRYPDRTEALGQRAAIAKRFVETAIGGDPALLRAALTRAAELYEAAFERTSNHWPGVNAIAMRRVIAQRFGEDSARIARLVPVVEFFAARAMRDDPEVVSQMMV